MCADALCEFAASLDFVLADKIDHRHSRVYAGVNAVFGEFEHSVKRRLAVLASANFLIRFGRGSVERHGHAVESFPSTTEDLPCGTDATINEGWLDLKIRNDTDNTFQIEISFDDKYMYGRILSQSPVNIEYSVFNSSVSYIKRNGRTYQIAPVYRSERDKKTCRETGAELYINQCEIGYELPNDIKIEERGA